ncbi:tyrosine-type recombinase/integrase [Bradyrhizobium sp. WSM1417]|uniref:tyrosine-type recombinase/integrase n=1 Tax=Bradyrhizobium sp. WSM1417 TaxID=754500 RepID=UPI0004AEC852|nr:tyrosine-type recombinase/integrase [Bradyrhizobium sp. WSM1417]
MPEILPRYVHHDPDRHGNDRLYFIKWNPDTKKLRKRRLREAVGSAEFFEEYAAALADRPYAKAVLASTKAAPPAQVKVNTLRWLCAKYMRESLEFRGYDIETQKNRRRILAALCREPASEDDPEDVGELGCDIPQDKIELLVNRKALTSIDAANARLKAIRKMSEWAVKQTPPLIQVNRAKAIDLLKRPRSTGHHTWSIPEIEIYVERHPPGTKAHLALMLFLLLGQRISDVAKFGRQHIRLPRHIAPKLRKIHPGRWLAFRQHKNRNRAPVDLVIPILPQLETVLGEAKDAGVLGAMTFLETAHGKPHTTKGLGNWFCDRCVEAGVPGRAHGLRKAGATMSAENGATPHQLMAIFGWKTLAQAELYTKAVQQQLMAGGAMSLLVFTPGGQDDDDD